MQKEAIKDATGICFETLCRTLLSVLLLVLIVGIGLGVARSALDLLAIALMIALMGVRIMAIRFSPKRRELFDGL